MNRSMQRWPMKMATMVPRARNGPNGTAVLPSGFAGGHHRDADDGAEEEPEEQSNGNETGIEAAEVGAEQRRQANVAIAHATPTGEVHDPHESKRDGRRQEHHPDPARLVHHQRGHAEQRHAESAVT